MSLRYKSALLLAVLESVYGTDEVPDGSNAIVTKGLKIDPLEGTTTSRDLDRPDFGADQEIQVNSFVKVSFDVELVGSGTLGTAPAWGPLLEACGCDETTVASTSVAYRPNSSSTDSMSMYFFMDGQRHPLLGARGTFSVMTDSQGIPYLKFVFTGLWVGPTSSAAPTPTGWSNFQIPQPVNNDNTTTVSLHGTAAVLKKFTLDQGNEVNHFDDPGEESVQITDRMSKGSISILAPPLSTTNYFEIAKANTLGTLQIVHGTTDVNRVIIDCTGNTCQVLSPKYGDDKGRATLDASLSFPPTSAQDDEWEIRLAAS